MSHKSKGSNWHPARVSGIQKQIMTIFLNKKAKDLEEVIKKRKKIKPINIKNSDWSI